MGHDRPVCLVLQGDDWSEHVVADGKLITGQNPQSSEVSRYTMPLVCNMHVTVTVGAFCLQRTTAYSRCCRAWPRRCWQH